MRPFVHVYVNKSKENQFGLKLRLIFEKLRISEKVVTLLKMASCLCQSYAYIKIYILPLSRCPQN
jgi:hypothetical protein